MVTVRSSIWPDHERLGRPLLEAAHVEQPGRVDLPAVDVGHPGHRHEDPAPAEHLGDQPEHPRLVDLRAHRHHEVADLADLVALGVEDRQADQPGGVDAGGGGAHAGHERLPCAARVGLRERSCRPLWRYAPRACDEDSPRSAGARARLRRRSRSRSPRCGEQGGGGTPRTAASASRPPARRVEAGAPDCAAVWQDGRAPRATTAATPTRGDSSTRHARMLVGPAYGALRRPLLRGVLGGTVHETESLGRGPRVP